MNRTQDNLDNPNDQTANGDQFKNPRKAFLAAADGNWIDLLCDEKMSCADDEHGEEHHHARELKDVEETHETILRSRGFAQRNADKKLPARCYICGNPRS